MTAWPSCAEPTPTESTFPVCSAYVPSDGTWPDPDSTPTPPPPLECDGILPFIDLFELAAGALPGPCWTLASADASPYRAPGGTTYLYQLSSGLVLSDTFNRANGAARESVYPGSTTKIYKQELARTRNIYSWADSWVEVHGTAGGMRITSNRLETTTTVNEILTFETLLGEVVIQARVMRNDVGFDFEGAIVPGFAFNVAYVPPATPPATGGGTADFLGVLWEAAEIVNRSHRFVRAETEVLGDGSDSQLWASSTYQLGKFVAKAIGSGHYDLTLYADSVLAQVTTYTGGGFADVISNIALLGFSPLGAGDGPWMNASFEDLLVCKTNSLSLRHLPVGYYGVLSGITSAPSADIEVAVSLPLAERSFPVAGDLEIYNASDVLVASLAGPHYGGSVYYLYGS